MSSIKHIAVLLTCYNRKEKTLNCLRSLYASMIPEGYGMAVFLVDDASTDGTGESVAKEFPKVKIIQGNGQLFWNRGMHFAWQTAANDADYDFYLWLNDDVHLMRESISDLLLASETHPEAIITGTMASEENGKVTYGGFSAQGKLIVPDGRVQACDKFHGNLVLIPRSAYKILGNLDPEFPHAIGDFDYALRAKKAGIQRFIGPSVSGYCEEHDHLPLWCLPEVPLKKRLKTLYSPLGNAHPRYFFYFEKRHYGLMTAIKHFLTLHIRAVFPKLWK